MRQVQLHEEEAQFASLIAEAEAGESLTILRAGKPVAQIIPFPEQPLRGADREAALQELIALMDKGLDLGGVWNGHDEIYDRETALKELDILLQEGLPLGGTPPTRDDMHDGR